MPVLTPAFGEMTSRGVSRNAAGRPVVFSPEETGTALSHCCLERLVIPAVTRRTVDGKFHPAQISVELVQ